MPVPSTRTPVRVARGTYANLSTVDALASLQEGEICFATDEQKLYVKQGGGLTAISAASAAAPAPGAVSASPAFAGGTGTQADPYQLTAVGVPFSGGTATSTQTVTVTGGPGDFLIVTDNSPTASGDRFANQSVGNLNAAGTIDIQFTYDDAPGTTTDNVTYVGQFQIGTTHFVWNVVQSNLAQLSQNSGATISGTVSVGSELTCNPGTIAGGTLNHQVTGYQWQKSFDGASNFFNITGATSSTYTLAGTDSNTFLRCIASHADSTDAVQGGPLTIDLTTGVTIQVPASAAPVINNVTLTEDDATGDRFTSQTFSIDVDMLNDGAPVSQKAIKATVTADIQTFADFESASGGSYSESIPSSVSQNIWAYDDYYGNAQWGYDNTSSNYQFWPAGMIGFIPPASSQFRVGFFHTVRRSDTSPNRYYTYLSEANIGLKTSLNDSDFTFVGDSAGWAIDSNSSYHQYLYYMKMHGAPLAPDGTTPFFIGCGHDNYAYYFGFLTGTSNYGFSTASYDRVRDAVIDKNYRAWGVGAYNNRTNSTGSYRNGWVVSSPGPWSNGRPNFGSYKQTTSYNWLGLDASGKYLVFNSNNSIYVADVDVATTPEQVMDSSTNIKSFSYGTPGTLSNLDQYAVNAIYFKDIEIVLVGSSRGVMRIDIANETASDATPGTVLQNTSNYCSPQGHLEDLRTPQYPNACSYYAYDPNNSERPARYVTTDGGITWTKQYYDNSKDDGNNANFAAGYDSAAFSSQILNMRYAQARSYSSSNTYNRIRTGYSVAQTHTQTVQFAASADCQYGVPYYPVGGPMNTASVIMMRSSGNRTSAVVNAGYEIQPGTVYESKTSTGNNTVSKFMVISSTGLVENQTSSDPGFVTIGPGTDIDLTFPSVMPSGDSPDDEFPAGATIQVEVEATNSVASDTYPSATITPA